MNHIKAYYIVIAGAVLTVAAIFAVHKKPIQQNSPVSNIGISTRESAALSTGLGSTSTASSSLLGLQWPVDRASERITKKPFGIYITPKTSPVQPERFQGYHTGTDFETFANEQNTDVAVTAACNGKLLMARYASGYGGVMVQSCVINNNPVTIVYGHIRLASVTKKVGEDIKAGERLAVLGTGYSSETDSERKHLHFGIHKGSAINIAGYAQQQSQLSDWLNPAGYLK